MKSFLTLLIIAFLAGCQTPKEHMDQERYRPQVHFTPKVNWVNAVSYTHLDVYKRQINH